MPINVYEWKLLQFLFLNYLLLSPLHPAIFDQFIRISTNLTKQLPVLSLQVTTMELEPILLKPLDQSMVVESIILMVIFQIYLLITILDQVCAVVWPAFDRHLKKIRRGVGKNWISQRKALKKSTTCSSTIQIRIRPLNIILTLLVTWWEICIDLSKYWLLVSFTLDLGY